MIYSILSKPCLTGNQTYDNMHTISAHQRIFLATDFFVHGRQMEVIKVESSFSYNPTNVLVYEHIISSLKLIDSKDRVQILCRLLGHVLFYYLLLCTGSKKSHLSSLHLRRLQLQ